MKTLLQSIGTSVSVCFAATALAGETTAKEEAKAPEPRFKISAWIDSGITFNPAFPDDNQNFGRLFTDRANEPLLNQATINFERALAPEPGKFDWGFKLQFLFGSDARYIHSLGLFSGTMGTSIDQPDIPEAYLNLHFPWIKRVRAGKLIELRIRKLRCEHLERAGDHRPGISSIRTLTSAISAFRSITPEACSRSTDQLVGSMAGVTRGINTTSMITTTQCI